MAIEGWKYVPDGDSPSRLVPDPEFLGQKRRSLSSKIAVLVSIVTLIASVTFVGVCLYYYFCYHDHTELKSKNVSDVKYNKDVDEIQKLAWLIRPGGDVCQQPVDSGTCMGYMPRWYFDGHGCKQFIYGGCGGNGNNFVTAEECQSRCRRDSEATAIENVDEQLGNPCSLQPSAGPCTRHVPRFYYDQADGGVCKKFFYGGCAGNGNNFITEQKCMEMCGVSDASNSTLPREQHRPGLCELPSDTGLCRALIYRWFHDSTDGQCKQFIWGGCGGNGNNFASKDKCSNYCKVNEKDVCHLPKDSGPCDAFLRRYHYDPQAGECKEFDYGGCGGNRNNFLLKKTCEDECAEGSDADQLGKVAEEEILTNDNREICLLPLSEGLCRAAIPRYYYNREKDRCEQFIYGGCDGNENNFNSFEECESRCGKEIDEALKLDFL